MTSYQLISISNGRYCIGSCGVRFQTDGYESDFRRNYSLLTW